MNPGTTPLAPALTATVTGLLQEIAGTGTDTGTGTDALRGGYSRRVAYKRGPQFSSYGKGAVT